MKLLNKIFLLFIVIIIACKKEVKEEINPCANGKKDNGEEQIDCGGSCKPCVNYPYMFLRSNGEPKLLSSKSIVFENGNYLLLGGYDTVLFQINLGPTLIEGINPIIPQNTGAAVSFQQYTFISGNLGISKVDNTKNELSGNFVAKFAKNLDTLRITDAQFEFLKY